MLQVVESGFDKIPAHRRDEAFRMNDGGWAAHFEHTVAITADGPRILTAATSAVRS